MFYTSLGRLLMVDLGEDEEKFDAFMMPLTQSFESLGQVLLNQSSGYNSEEVSQNPRVINVGTLPLYILKNVNPEILPQL